MPDAVSRYCTCLRTERHHSPDDAHDLCEDGTQFCPRSARLGCYATSLHGSGGGFRAHDFRHSHDALDMLGAWTDGCGGIQSRTARRGSGLMHISCIFSGLGAEARANVPRREAMVNQGFLLPHMEVVTASNVAKHQSHLQRTRRCSVSRWHGQAVQALSKRFRAVLLSFKWARRVRGART